MNTDLIISAILLLVLFFAVFTHIFPVCSICNRVKFFMEGLNVISDTKEELEWQCNECRKEQ